MLERSYSTVKPSVFSRCLQPGVVLLLLAMYAAIHPPHALAQRPLGVDLSSYEGGGITWPTVKTSGVSWAWAKAAEGTATDGWIGQDPDFTVNVANAKAAGVILGYYYYCHPESDPGLAGADAEAAFFWNIIKPYVKADGLTLMPMLDFEQDVTAASPPYTAATLSAWLNEWCQDLVNYGKANGVVIKPVVYTFISYANGTGGYGPGVDSTVTQWPLNMANVNFSTAQSQTGAPATTYPWPTWNFWQYNWYGLVPGVPGTGTGTTNCDEDVFNGTAAQLMANFVVTTLGPQITSQPTNLTVWSGSNAIFSVTASNNSAIQYQWKFNGTNISAATSSQYSLTNVQVANAGGYSVALMATNGTNTSSTAFLSVLGPLTNAPASIAAPAGMVDWWPADGNAVDIFNTNNGTLAGGVTYAPGEIGTAFHFDGSTSCITLSNQTGIPLPWTVCLWVNRENTPQTSAALMSDGTNSIKLEQYGTARQVGVTREGVTDNTFSPAYSAPQGVWTHLAFVGTSSGTTLYVNGVVQGTVTNKLTLPRFYLGVTYNANFATGFADYMLGSLDEVMVFNNALTTTQINAIYSAGAAGVMKAPVIMSAGLNGSGLFYINLQGQTGKNFTGYNSSDLKTWTPIATIITNINGVGTYTDSNSPNRTRRFFRASQSY